MIRTSLPLALLASFAAGLAGCASQESARSAATTTIQINEAERIDRARSLAERAARAETPEEGIDLYRRAVTVWRDFPAAWNNLGVLLLDDGQYLDAAEAFVNASERAATDPRPLYNLGLAWERTRHLREAAEHYQSALDRDPRYLPALRGLIYAQDRLGKTTEDTLERLRVALMLEDDPRWREYFEHRKLSAQTELQGEES
jgi:tetratricopeptide (TPR) repeat protein